MYKVNFYVDMFDDPRELVDWIYFNDLEACYLFLQEHDKKHPKSDFYYHETIVVWENFKK